MGCKKIFSHTQGFSYNWHLLDITQKKYTVNTHVIEIASLRGLGQGSGLILSGRLGFRPELKTTVGEFRPIVTSIMHTTNVYSKLLKGLLCTRYTVYTVSLLIIQL